MTATPPQQQFPVVRSDAAPIVLGTLGLSATLSASAVTFLPWLAMTVGVMHPDAGLLLSVVGPGLILLLMVGAGLSVAGIIVSAIRRFGVGLGLGVAGVIVAITFVLALFPTQMGAVLLGLWF